MATVLFYNSSKTYLSNNINYEGSTVNDVTFITPSNCEYIAINVVNPSGNQQPINLSNMTNIELKELIELRGIGNNKDYLYKNSEKWYKKNVIKEIVLIGAESENWSLQSINNYGIANYNFGIVSDYDNSVMNQALCNYFTAQTSLISTTEVEGFMMNASGYLYIRIKSSTANTVQNFRTWLGTHNTVIDYVLKTYSDTEITDSTLISQLEAIQHLKQYQDTTIITIDDIESFDVEYDGNRIEQIQAQLLLKQNITDNTLQTTNKTVPTAINEVNSIAKGANQAISYASYSAMITAVNAMANNALNVGQNIYIVTLDVPDLWVSSIESTSSTYTYTTDEAFMTALETNGYVQVGYYKLSALETQKVDLANYVEFTDYATQNTAGVVKVWTSYNADNELGLNISTE